MVGSAIVIIACKTNCAIAQSNIVPDSTLGAENSTVTPNFNGLPVERIDGGAIRGQNLFHSFLEFNVSSGRGAYFFSPNANIQNILARVTGGLRSDILGTLGTLGNSNPNLFLINPNGIVFGRDARLDVGASFVATTASAIGFGERGFFSAKNPNLPPLLTVNPSAFLFNQITAVAAIQNNSQAPVGTDPSDSFPAFGLRVPNGRSLLLVGGNISMDGGGLYAFGGRVELGGLAEAGTVGLNVHDSYLSLSFPDAVARSDVLLTRGAEVLVLADKGGSIAIDSGKLDLQLGSRLGAGITSRLGWADSKAGNVDINAQATVNLQDESLIANEVQSGGIGKGGNISVIAGSVSVSNGSALVVSTRGRGDAGNVTIVARDTVSFVGQSGAFTSVESGAIGQGGTISITAGSLSVTNGAQFVASTRARGDAGNIFIVARDTVSLDGGSRIASTVEGGAVGKGGNVNITTGSLSATNGAQLITGTRGRGDVGKTLINARDTVSFASGSAAFSTVSSGGIGNGGEISITTGSLFVTDAQLGAGTRGRGDAGNVTIVARDVVSFDGVGAAFSSVLRGGIGKGGDINITTGSFSVSNGAQLVADTRGIGNAGNIIIDARDTVFLNGISSDGFASALGTSVGREAVGNGGDIKINASSLSVTNSAVLFASTAGSGNAGRIRIQTQDRVIFDGAATGALSQVLPGAIGNGGDINIIAGSVSIINDAIVGSSSAGQGRAGNVEVTARSLGLNNRGRIDATTLSGDGGNISLTLQDLLLLRSGSQISTTAGTARQGGDGGNITIVTPNGFIVTIPNENSDITANAFTGKGGRVDITAKGIFGIQPRLRETLRSDITASSEFGVNGEVTLREIETEPTRLLVELPVNLVDATQQVTTGCNPGGRQRKGSFTATGRSGLAPSPTEPLMGDAVIATWVTPPSEVAITGSREVGSLGKNNTTTPNSITQIVEASAWAMDDNGDIVLIAGEPATPDNPTSPDASCRAS
jgi:filamentous hemagglutinin family protein